MRKCIACILAALILMLGKSDVSYAQESGHLPVIDLTVGIYLVKAEVAVTEPHRQQGLMFRKKMGVNEGMLFVYNTPVRLCMWMKNTLIPLSVAFIDDDGKVVNIEDMKPETTQVHCTKTPVRYALEMNRGWFNERRIVPGNAIQGLP